MANIYELMRSKELEEMEKNKNLFGHLQDTSNFDRYLRVKLL